MAPEWNVSMTCPLFSRRLRVWARSHAEQKRLKAASSHKLIAIAPERVAARRLKLTAGNPKVLFLV
jgi:hypothetical protein